MVIPSGRKEHELNRQRKESISSAAWELSGVVLVFVFSWLAVALSHGILTN